MKNEVSLRMLLSNTIVSAVLLFPLIVPVPTVAQQTPASVAAGQAPAGDPVRAGAELFAKSGCQFCHGPAGLGTERAPSLRAVGKRKSDEAIRHQIHDGGQMMPPFAEALTDDEIASLSAFLRAKDAWKLVPPPAGAAPTATPPTASK